MRLLKSGCWLLAVSFWLLAFGYWQLAIHIHVFQTFLSGEWWVVSGEFLLNFNITAQRDDGHAQCHPEFSSGSVRGEGQEKARSEMLKQVQHDILSQLLFILFYITKDDTTELMVILNLVQDLSAEKDKKRHAVRCWNKLTLFNLLTLGITKQAWLCSRLIANFSMIHDIWESFVIYTLILVKPIQYFCQKQLIAHRSNRLKDGMPKANSRGFLNPWRKDISLKVRLKDGECQTCPRTWKSCGI